MPQNTKKLKRSIIGYFVLTNILIGVLGFGGASYNFFEQLTAMTFSKLEQTVNARADAISEWVRLAIIKNFQTFSISEDTLALENYYHPLISRADLLTATIRNIDRALIYNQEFQSLTRLDRDGRLILQRGQQPPASFEPNLDPTQTKLDVSLHMRDQFRPQMVITSPLISREGAFLGLDVVLFDTNPLLRLLSESYVTGLNSRTYMVSMENGQQELIYSSESAVQYVLPEEIKTIIDQAITTENRIASANGLVCAVGQIPDTDWLIAIVVDRSLLLQPLREQIRNSLIYFFIFLSCALIGLWFLTLKPLTGRVEETTEKLLKESAGRKKTENQLLVATHRSQMARQAKSHFLTNLSHEIRTPLNAVIGMTDLALFTNLTKEQRSYLGAVKKAADDLLIQINDLLDLSKLQDGLMITELRSFSLSAFLREITKVYEAAGRDKNITFTCGLPQNISPFRLGDKLRLKQVLDYLLDNAFKFTSAGGQVELKVTALPPKKNEADLLSFEVSDTGVGINPTRLKTIFDPFVQIDDSLTRSSGGAGLGLAVTKRLLELMGGDIKVESTEGVGSKFTVILNLPLSPEKNYTENPMLTLEKMRGLKVILADGDEVNRCILDGYLNHWGVEVSSFESKSAILKYLNDNPAIRPDVFIIGDLMPGLTSQEMGKKLAEKYPSVPIIFLTSLESPSIKYHNDTGEATAIFITKPTHQEQLKNALAALLKGKKYNKKSKPHQKLSKVDNPRTLLVVDDNQLNRRLVSTLLTKRGHNVNEAENGKEALSAISAKKYDTVFMDIQMPVMDGLSAVRTIRSHPEIYGEDLPVVAMTAHALPGDQETFLSAGMTAYISKPFKPNELIAAAEAYRTAVNCSKKYYRGDIVAAELDRSAIMDNFVGDEELLFESIDLFLERIETHMTALKKSVAAKNPDAFMPEAHTIKGMIGIFSIGRSYETVKRLELKGRDKKIDGIEEDLADLEKELEALIGALRDWRSGN